jgi:hypothetical protein
MPTTPKINSLRRKHDRFLGILQLIAELVDEYQQTGTHNVIALKIYKENIEKELDRIRPVLDELKDRGKELEAFNPYIALQFRIIKLMEGEQPANNQRTRQNPQAAKPLQGLFIYRKFVCLPSTAPEN